MRMALHIVAFNVPLPANYGGAIDMFCRLKALHEAGVRIFLHCFSYGRPPVPELERYCDEVYYYPRCMSALKALERRPFIVSSRDNKALVHRLLLDRFPILLEGLHCTALLGDDRFLGRTVLVRTHNVESDYYGRLAHAERNLLRRCYLAVEARKIARYESILSRATCVLAITEADRDRFCAMGIDKVSVAGGAHPFTAVMSRTGTGSYALYQGNLAVAENYRAAEQLMDKVFRGSPHRLVVAGGNPPQWLVRKANALPNVQLEGNPDDGTMQRLIAEAQVNVLTTEQPTGLKLKLLNALYNGRHCLVNGNMVAGTGLEGLCTVADGWAALRSALDRLMAMPFSASAIAMRKQQLAPFSARHAVEPILALLQADGEASPDSR